MRVNYSMSKDEINRAITVYMALKGYTVKGIKYDVSATASMFLGMAMDTSVSFNGAKLILEKKDSDIEKVTKIAKAVHNGKF